MESGRRQRFELLIERFLEHARVIGWSPRTIDAYRSHLGIFVAYLDSETDAQEITEVLPETLHAYQTHLYTWTDEDGRGLSIATQAARLSVVRSFFRYLVRTDVLLYDPAANVMPPKRKGILPRSILTKKEVARLLAAPDLRTPLGLRDRAMLEILYSTGIRNAELRALQVYDLDLDRGLLRVNEGKNAKDRVVPMGHAASNYVREYLTESRPKLLAHRNGDGPTEQTVFLSRTGRPLRTLGVIVPIQKHARRAGIERRITPHTFRHTFATHMLQGRADIRHIQAMLGHSSVATTQIYTRVDVTDLKAVHRRCHPRERR
jgi:integrase/recombinase XerD